MGTTAAKIAGYDPRQNWEKEGSISAGGEKKGSRRGGRRYLKGEGRYRRH